MFIIVEEIEDKCICVDSPAQFILFFFLPYSVCKLLSMLRRPGLYLMHQKYYCQSNI